MITFRVLLLAFGRRALGTSIGGGHGYAFTRIAPGVMREAVGAIASALRLVGVAVRPFSCLSSGQHTGTGHTLNILHFGFALDFGTTAGVRLFFDFRSLDFDFSNFPMLLQTTIYLYTIYD